MNSSNEIYNKVHDHYGSLARSAQPANSSAIAKAFGYSAHELESITSDANLGVSCGNPLAIASLTQGETVIDLGSGAGLDALLASKKIGPTGHVFGIDMNKDMLARARKNQAQTPEATNISFIESKITSVPLEDDIADCIISNCVINLVPESEKPTVFAEMGRLLKAGGRVAISDILARKPLTGELRDSVALYVGCVAGASMEGDYVRWLRKAGFDDITIVDARSDLNVYADLAQGPKADISGCCVPSAATDSEGQEAAGGCCAPSNAVNASERSAMVAGIELKDIDVNEWAGSFKIFAVKK
ncbi:SAM-dependent methyltransferase UbiE/COQ5 family protein [Microthyrium microscopicum]|uniref:Arsenite methyltransferase n=1 Tax=Microthyrium microscopicum TaxID=703497 RepID=A0A6A6TXR2_9PEZI|nr:SAM-dependent methyltransferase UbiE/COQ5 family protein [Microthyrium microscopicum]